MKKNSFIWILAIAIFVPMLISSCVNKDELVGNYELDKKDAKALFGDSTGITDNNIKMSLNKDESATFTISISTPLFGEEKVGLDVEYKGKWDYNMSKQLILELKDYEVKLSSDNKAMQALLDADKEETIKALDEKYGFKKIQEAFDGTKALNVTEVKDDGFIVEGKDGKEAIKFNKLK